MECDIPGPGGLDSTFANSYRLCFRSNGTPRNGSKYIAQGNALGIHNQIELAKLVSFIIDSSYGEN